MLNKTSKPSASKTLFNLVITILLIVCLGFIGLVYKYRDEKTAGQILTSAYYKIFGLPSVNWDTAQPAEEGLSKSRLENLGESLESNDTYAFIVIRGGKLVYEQYSGKFRKTTKYSTAAMAKAVTAIPALLAAMSEGRISLDDHLWRYYPKLKHDPFRSKILIKHLAFHTSGIEDVDFYMGKEGKLTGWKAEYYKNHDRRFLDALTLAPVKFTPGSREEYSGIGYYALAYAVTRSIQDSENSDIYTYLREKIMRPLEIPDTSWHLSYGKSHLVDGMNLYAFGSGAVYTARASARVGELMLNNGTWKGKTLVKQTLIDQVLAINTDTSNMVSENHGWTLNVKNRWPSLPADAYAGLGGGHQITLVIPSQDMVVVRYGRSFHGDDNIFQGEIYTSALDQKFFKPLFDSIIGPSSRMTNQIKLH